MIFLIPAMFQLNQKKPFWIVLNSLYSQADLQWIQEFKTITRKLKEYLPQQLNRKTGIITFCISVFFCKWISVWGCFCQIKYQTAKGHQPFLLFRWHRGVVGTVIERGVALDGVTVQMGRVSGTRRQGFKWHSVMKRWGIVCILWVCGSVHSFTCVVKIDFDS